MPMIEPINGMMLINAFRQGQSDKQDRELEAFKLDQARRQSARQDQVQTLLGQAFGGGAQPSVATMATKPPAQAPQAPDQGFAPQAAPDAPIAPVAASGAPPPRGKPDPNILRKLVILDPEMGTKIVGAFKNMSDMELAQIERKNTMMGAAAMTLERVPEQQRGQVLQQIAPQLIEAGWTPEEIAGANLSNQGLKMLQATAIDLDKLHDNEAADREFAMGKTVSVAPGGAVATVKPVIGADGSVGMTTEYVIGGGGGSSDIPHVSTPDEARRLPPGTQFYDPNGVLRTVPGGQTGSAPSGNFPSGQ